MRKNESGLEVLFGIFTMIPAWVGPAFAVFAYAVFRYLIPWLSSGESNEMAAVGRSLIADLSRLFAPLVSVGILLVWVVAEIKKWVDRRRLDRMAPAWVGPALAILAYPVFRYLIPWLLTSGQSNEMVAVGRGVMATFMQAAAPFVPAVILLVWLMAEIKKWVDRRRLDRTDNIDDIRRLSWPEFELLVAEAYRRKGYAVEETGSASGDGGVDLILYAGGERTLVQCKHWKERQVGVKVVRELYGVMHDHGTTRGVIVCFGDYTQEARDFAERNGIDMVTGRELGRLISEVKASPGRSRAGQGPKVAPAAAESAVPGAATAPLCPVCGSRMVLRAAQKGPNAGSRFWGCPQYPRCRGKRQLGV